MLYFYLKLHQHVFGGRASPDRVAGLRGGEGERRGREGRRKELGSQCLKCKEPATDQVKKLLFAS